MLERIAIELMTLLIFYGGGIGLVYLILHLITENNYKQ
jgi:hypothetical protein